MVKDIEILSERSGECRLYNPWDGPLRVTDTEGRPTGVEESNGICRFPVIAGTTYRVEREKP